MKNKDVFRVARQLVKNKDVVNGICVKTQEQCWKNCGWGDNSWNSLMLTLASCCRNPIHMTIWPAFIFSKFSLLCAADKLDSRIWRASSWRKMFVIQKYVYKKNKNKQPSVTLCASTTPVPTQTWLSWAYECAFIPSRQIITSSSAVQNRNNSGSSAELCGAL